jgi:multiple sugar transport system permease protein
VRTEGNGAAAAVLGRSGARRRIVGENLAAYAFIAPFLLFYLAFTFWPLLQGFWISFTKWNIIGPKRFIGLANYRDLLGDGVFWSSLGHTLFFVLVSTPLFVVGAFVIAAAIDSASLRGKGFFRMVVFLPNVLSVSIISYLWGYVLSPYTGLMNAVIHGLGIRQEVYWTGSGGMAWLSIVMVTAWWTIGYNVILYLAGIQDIPVEHYEAAALDGANGLQRLWHITLPSLRNIHVLVLFLQVIASFKIFGQVLLLTGGGPAGSTRTLIQFIYETGFQRFFMGAGSAGSFILFVIILAVSIAQLRLMDRLGGA